MKRVRYMYPVVVLAALLITSLACDLPVEFSTQGENLGATQTQIGRASCRERV